MRSPQVFHLLRRFVLLEKHLKKLELKYFWGIDLTLERAWNSLKWNEKLSLVLSVVRGITSSADMSRNNLKESSTDDSTIQLYEQLSFSYPSLQQPLFHERDTVSLFLSRIIIWNQTSSCSQLKNYILNDGKERTKSLSS
ncbi:hypothetical protein ACSBR2_002234 [Camellia fascicularis]